MTEMEYVLERFGKKFSAHKCKKIALYGSGSYADAIREKYGEEYSFCGLDDPDLEMVVLAEHKTTLEPDYCGMLPVCSERGLELFDMYGVDEIAAHRDAETCTFMTLRDWLHISLDYDVISFDAFNTFLAEDPYRDGRLTARPILKEFALKAKEQGKRVVFISRKSRPFEEVMDALIREGMIADETDAENCLFRRRGEDLGYRELRERFPGARILHIGAGVVNSCIIPKFYDIDTYRMVYFEQLMPESIPEEEVIPGPNDWKRYAESAAGPVITGYLTWLIKRADEMGADKILFASRDGWILHRIYKYLEEKLGDLVPGVYFYSGRLPAFKAFQDADVKAGYLEYMESIGLRSGGNYLITDFVAEGMAQIYLDKFVPFTLTGMYFGRPYYARSVPDRVEYYLKGDDPYLISNFMEMETVMTSPEPSTDGFTKTGKPYFGEEIRSDELLAQNAFIQDEIFSYAKKYFDNEYVRGVVIDPACVESSYKASGSHRLIHEPYNDLKKEFHKR
ncbi:MAG: hypothetical protein IIY88_03145 [Eubacterium sp.]|nr:hypothetical protein [Eubacterium sp.]